MAGHSHWAKIQHKKALADQKRGKLFAKLSRLITIAAREGADPDMNPRLREAIEKARSFNMPSSTIERAIKKATGEDKESSQLQEFLFEALGPGQAKILIEGITDNRNRALFEIRQILAERGGKLVEEGAVKWMFERKGFLLIDPEEQAEPWNKKEDLELLLIESGAQDIREREGLLEVIVKDTELESTKKALGQKGVKIKDSFVGWEAKEEMVVSEKDKEKLEKLFEELDELEDVQEIYTNISL